MKSFITGLRFDKILSHMKNGDYLFIEFGHNDMKVNWPQPYVEGVSVSMSLGSGPNFPAALLNLLAYFSNLSTTTAPKEPSDSAR